MVAPIWPPTGGGSAMGDAGRAEKFLGQVRKGCRFAKRLRELGVRPNGVVRIDSACGVEPWLADPEGNQKQIAETFREACTIAEDHGERLAAEGEICWGGMHSWRRMLQLLEMVDRPQTLGFQADMAHTLLYLLGYNAPEDAILPQDFDWNDRSAVRRGLPDSSPTPCAPGRSTSTSPRTTPRCTARGSHDKTGRHCLATDPNGKLDIVAPGRLLAARRRRPADEAIPPRLLGRLHVPQRRDDEARRRGTTSLRR